MESSWSSAALGPIEEQQALDRVGDAVQKAIDPLFARPEATPIKNFLHGTWLGHALHPVLSDIPIGFWTASLLLDAVGASVSATVVNAAGSAAAVATAATGIADWTGTHGRERRLGVVHGALNSVGLGFQLASLASRLAFKKRRAVTLSAIGWSISSVAAYIGGELVFSRGVMVNHDAWTAGPADWTAVCGEAEVPEGGTRKVDVEGHSVLLYKENGNLYALEDACAHAGGPLSEGEVKDGIVTCPWHGSQFRLTDGRVCRGPATFPQLRLEARVKAGRVEIRGRQG
jgi:nitrite reductase/ring-hydroxylating ferredoxin subunit/uncharacterized membrane protein